MEANLRKRKSAADLGNLNPYDLYPLYYNAKNRLEKGQVFRLTNTRVKEVMRQLIKFVSKTNFQIALELGVDKVVVIAPEEHLENINKIHSWLYFQE